MASDVPASSSPWIEISLPTNASTVSPSRFRVGTFMRMQWNYHDRAFFDHVGPISLVLIRDRRATSTATHATTGRDKRDRSGNFMSGESRSAAATLRGKRADLVVVIQSPKVDPEMTHFSWYIPVDACTRGWCEPNPLVLGFINNTGKASVCYSSSLFQLTSQDDNVATPSYTTRKLLTHKQNIANSYPCPDSTPELQSWTQNVLAMTSRPFFISATQDVVSQDSGSPSTGPTITMLPSTISISDPAAPRPNQVTTTTTTTTATRSFLSTTSSFPTLSPTPHDTAARDRESLLGYFLVAFICFCLGSAFTLAVLSCLRRFQESRHRSRASSPTESDCESSSFSTEPITGSGTHSSSENPSAGKQRREEGGTAASTGASASAETSSVNIAELHPRGYFSESDLGPSNSSSNCNRRKSSMAPKSFYQHQVPSESWSDPGVGVVAVGSKSTLQAQQQMGSAVEQMPAMASTSSETHRGALASKSARVKSDSSIRMGFELVRVATAHSGRFIRPAAAAAAAGERVDSGHIRLGSGSGSGGGSVSEPALPLAADGSTNAPSSQHIQAHLVHFSKEGQGVVSGPHEATAAASSATGGVDTSELVEDSSCSRTVTSEDGSVATVVGVCFDVISPPPPPPPSPAVQPAESCLEIIEDSITVLVNDIAPILTTTISSSPMLVCESDSNIRVQPIIIDPTTTATTSTVQPQQLQQDLHDTVSSSTAQSHLNDEVISFYLPPPPFPQRQRSLTGLPIASRHRALPIRDLDLSASRPATPLPSVNSHSRSRSRGDSLQATQTQRNFSLPILHSSGISDSLKGEGFDVRVQHWRKPAELKEKLGHITTIEELEDYALCGEALTTEVGPPPVIRAPGSGLQRQPASYPPPPPTTTTMDGIEVGESSNSHLGSSEGGRARQSVRSLESRVEMLKEFPIPPTIVVVEAESQEESQGDSGSGLGL